MKKPRHSSVFICVMMLLAMVLAWVVLYKMMPNPPGPGIYDALCLGAISIVYVLCTGCIVYLQFFRPVHSMLKVPPIDVILYNKYRQKILFCDDTMRLLNHSAARMCEYAAAMQNMVKKLPSEWKIIRATLFKKHKDIMEWVFYGKDAILLHQTNNQGSSLRASILQGIYKNSFIILFLLLSAVSLIYYTQLRFTQMSYAWQEFQQKIAETIPSHIVLNNSWINDIDTEIIDYIIVQDGKPIFSSQPYYLELSLEQDYHLNDGRLVLFSHTYPIGPNKAIIFAMNVTHIPIQHILSYEVWYKTTPIYFILSLLVSMFVYLIYKHKPYKVLKKWVIRKDDTQLDKSDNKQDNMLYKRNNSYLHIRHISSIKNEIISLANTLDEDFRSYIMHGMHDISRIDMEGGIYIIADTFKKVSSQIQRQHQQMQMLIEELKEALKDQKAYNALQKELEVAFKVQSSILPSRKLIYEHQGKTIVSGHMTGAKEISGDFYDYFALNKSGNKIATVIADVSGKGIPAALFMATTNSMFKALARQQHYEPAKTLEHLNKMLCSINEETFFVTLFYGVLDAKKGTFTYANAGHPPAYLIGQSDVKELYTEKSIALGITQSHFACSQHSIQLEPGEKIFMYTDGLTEAMNSKQELFTQKRLEDAIRSAIDISDPDNFTNAIMSKVLSFTKDSEQYDDMTYLCASYKCDATNDTCRRIT